VKYKKSRYILKKIDFCYTCRMDEAFLRYTSLAHALTDICGRGISVSHTGRLSGGDINKAYALSLSDGKRIFMKANSKDNAAFFTAEAAVCFLLHYPLGRPSHPLDGTPSYCSSDFPLLPTQKQSLAIP